MGRFVHNPSWTNLPIRCQRLKRATDVSRTFEDSRQPREVTTDAKTFAADRRQDLENRFICNIVADEDRHTAGEWRMSHQPANALAFVDARTFDFEHSFTQQQFCRLTGQRRSACGYMPAETLCLLRRFSVGQSM